MSDVLNEVLAGREARDEVADAQKQVEETVSMSEAAPSITAVQEANGDTPKKTLSLSDYLKNPPSASAVSLASEPRVQTVGLATVTPAGLNVVGELSLPPGLELFSPSDLTSGYFHLLLFGETDARKSTTAAEFGGPEHTRIVLVRRPEQLIPLRDKGFGPKTVAHCTDDEAVKYALFNAESIWPDWAKDPERVLVIDDLTRLKDQLLEGNETRIDRFGNVKAVTNNMQQHKGAKDDLYTIMQSIFKKPQHIICTATAAVYNDDISHQEFVTPDLPPAMQRMTTTEFEFVFFIDKVTWRLTTTQRVETFTKKDEHMRDVTKYRTIFAKRKLPIHLDIAGLLYQDEDMDLRKIWKIVKEGKREGK